MQLHLLFPSGGGSNRQFAAFVEFDDTFVGESDFGVRPFARPHAVTIFQSRADFAGQPLSRSRPLMLHDPHDGGNRRRLRPAHSCPNAQQGYQPQPTHVRHLLRCYFANLPTCLPSPCFGTAKL
jgi:hypothetical protein